MMAYYGLARIENAGVGRWGLAVIQITDHMISLEYAWISKLSLDMLEDKKMRDFASCFSKWYLPTYQPYSYV